LARRLLWTHDELDAAIPKITAKIGEIEAEEEAARPLPPMTVEECLTFANRFLETAGERVLSHSERFMFGQLLSILVQAVRAEMLGKKGRYFCLSEADIDQAVKGD
jgi:hypothetical protein